MWKFNKKTVLLQASNFAIFLVLWPRLSRQFLHRTCVVIEFSCVRYYLVTWFLHPENSVGRTLHQNMNIDIYFWLIDWTTAGVAVTWCSDADIVCKDDLGYKFINSFERYIAVNLDLRIELYIYSQVKIDFKVNNRGQMRTVFNPFNIDWNLPSIVLGPPKLCVWVKGLLYIYITI